MSDAAQAVMFYPFILMDQLAGNGLPDPWTGAADQPALPWRGRITLIAAPGRDGSPDGTAAAEAEVAAFFGTAQRADFAIGDGSGHLYRAGGMVLIAASSCTMRALRGGGRRRCLLHRLGDARADADPGRGRSFPAVAALRALAARGARAAGARTRRSAMPPTGPNISAISRRTASGDVYFHLDPLWADDEIDFIGIDNYMPLSDWRDGDGSCRMRDCGCDLRPRLSARRISRAARAMTGTTTRPRRARRRSARRSPMARMASPGCAATRTSATGGRNAHHERIGGVRQAAPTAWVPQSKPIWFTEYGCAAIDKGTNQPNKFLDPKSSESVLPHYSNGRARRADPAAVSARDARATGAIRPTTRSRRSMTGRCSTWPRAFVWAWDARPYPWFPGQSRRSGRMATNYPRGHWINGRASARTLASVVAEICARAGADGRSTSRRLYGFVRGYAVTETWRRAGGAAAADAGLWLRRDRTGRAAGLPHARRARRGGARRRTMLAVSDEIDGRCDRDRAAPRPRWRAGSGCASSRRMATTRRVAEEAVLPDEATHAVARAISPWR